jgi:cellulose synthase/poly-beta-1,6-N-acetylglucosamine synthase-like glycosyltransferase
MKQTFTAIVCAYNEAPVLPACIHSLLSQTRPPDEILIVNNARSDDTGLVARSIPGVRVIDEPTKGLVNRKRLVDLVDVWEAANRDDLFSVTSLKHYPYIANSDFHKPKHLYSWKTLLRCEKDWDAIAKYCARMSTSR